MKMTKIVVVAFILSFALTARAQENEQEERPWEHGDKLCGATTNYQECLSRVLGRREAHLWNLDLENLQKMWNSLPRLSWQEVAWRDPYVMLASDRGQTYVEHPKDPAPYRDREDWLRRAREAAFQVGVTPDSSNSEFNRVVAFLDVANAAERIGLDYTSDLFLADLLAEKLPDDSFTEYLGLRISAVKQEPAKMRVRIIEGSIDREIHPVELAGMLLKVAESSRGDVYRDILWVTLRELEMMVKDLEGSRQFGRAARVSTLLAVVKRQVRMNELAWKVEWAQAKARVRFETDPSERFQALLEMDHTGYSLEDPVGRRRLSDVYDEPGEMEAVKFAATLPVVPESTTLEYPADGWRGIFRMRADNQAVALCQVELYGISPKTGLHFSPKALSLLKGSLDKEAERSTSVESGQRLEAARKFAGACHAEAVSYIEEEGTLDCHHYAEPEHGRWRPRCYYQVTQQQVVSQEEESDEK
ncbi:MAG: hypothetical protein V1821_03390 [bacterium]